MYFYLMEFSHCVQGCSTYIGATPIVHVFKTCKLNVIITSHMVDATLFLSPMVIYSSF
jgi:hypothetical protein